MVGGPRDWAPPGFDEPARPSGRLLTSERPPSAPAKNAAGWFSLALGVVALLYAMFQAGTFSLGHGFAVTTAGLMAIAYGVFALALRRRLEATLFVVPLLGVILGVAGTGIMGVYAAAHYLGNDDPGLPGIGIVAGTDPTKHPDAAADDGTLPPVSDPRLVLPTAKAVSAAEEFRSLALHADTVAVLLNDGYPDAKPASVTVDGTDGLLSTIDGRPLTYLPIGTAVIYEPSVDRQTFTLTLVGATFGTRVVYDGATGSVYAG